MISEHFSEEELVHTDADIENECPDHFLYNAKTLADDCLEPMRILVGALRVDSWFRNKELNDHVGGEKLSAHLEARAADVVPRGNVLSAFKMVVVSDIPYDKIIHEKRNSEWIHIQHAQAGASPRRLAFTAHVGPNGRMVYEPFHA